MSVSFEAFDLGSYLLGSLTPVLIAFVVAGIQVARGGKNRPRR